MKIENGVLKEISEEDVINGELIIPEGVEEISDNVLVYSKSLKKIIIPSTLKRVGKDVCMDCPNLAVIISKSKAVKSAIYPERVETEEELQEIINDCKNGQISSDTDVINCFNNYMYK